MPSTARRLAVPVAVIAVGACAWWVTGLAPFSTAATVAVVGSGAMVAIGSRRGGGRLSEDDVVTRRDAVIWGTLAVALAGWQVGALVQHPRVEHPTLSALANAVLDPRPVRTAAFVGWLAGMVWLARR